MAVRVDEAGDHEVAGGVDDACPRGAGRARLQDRGDVVALDEYRAAFDDRAALVHDHDRAAVDEEGGVCRGRAGVGPGCGCARRQGEGREHGARLLTKDFVHAHGITLVWEAAWCQRFSS